LAVTAESHLIRPEQLEWLPSLDIDYENLRLAFEWSLSKESAESSLNLCKALGWFWEIRGFWLEGLNWLNRALSKPAQDAKKNEIIARARALSTRAQLEWKIGSNSEQILSPAKTSLALATEASEKRDMAIARFYVGVALGMFGVDEDQAISLLEQSFAEFEELNELYWQARSLYPLAVLGRQTKLKAHDRYLKWLELARKAGERQNLADALSVNSDWLLRFNQEDRAVEYADEASRLYKQLGSDVLSVNTIFATIAWINGDTQKASSLYTELLEHFRVLGDRAWTFQCTENLGLLAMEEGILKQAQEYLEQALMMVRDVGAKPLLANCLTELSNLCYLKGNIEEFKQNFREAFSLTNHSENVPHKAYILSTILGSLYFQKPESSAQLLGVINNYEKEDYIRFTPVEKRYCRRAETYIRKTLGNAAFESAFAEGQKMSLDDGLDLAWKTMEEIDQIIFPSNTEPKMVPDRLPSRLEADKQKYGGLTARERQVAIQIAQGKSNQEISAELFVGLKTVEAHVTRILSKLGFTSRAQIAAWAVGKGLSEAPSDLDTLAKNDYF